MQRSEEWFKIRAGKITASRICDIMPSRNGYPAGRQKYISQLIAERLTGEIQESYTNEAIQHGIETEAKARQYYEDETSNPVTEVDFIDAPDGSMSGASPDGLVGDDGMIEIKCPNTSTHIDTLLGEPIPKKYLYQMQWQLYCAGREWVDFVSFDDRLKEAPIFIKRVKKDESMILKIKYEVDLALKEIDEHIKKIKGFKNE